MTHLAYLKQIARYNLAYRLNLGKPLPDNLTISITRACQSACLTCNCGADTKNGLVKLNDELSINEWLQIVKNIDWKLAFVTISGGEPSMSRNLEPVALAFAEKTHPDFITIPTNALTPTNTVEKISRILSKSPKKVIWHINVSVDGIGAIHDYVRGVKGNFDKCLQTISGLLTLREQYQNLRVGVHTVVSNYSIDSVRDTVDFFSSFPLDNHISEIAEERFELGTIGRAITPYDTYVKVIPQLKRALGNRKDGHTRRMLRKSYYDFVEKWIAAPDRQPVSCMAGLASCHITEKGQLVSCCTRWTQRGLIGDLRKNNYDIKQLWFNDKAKELRASIKRQECACPLASAAYSSLLINPATLLKIVSGV